MRSLISVALAIASTAANDSVNVQLTTQALTASLPGNFASFSYEVSCGIPMFTFNNKPRASFVNLMQNLQSVSGGRGPNMRIGGNSADESAYVPSSDPLPTNDTYRITDADFAAYLMAVPLWNGTITPGVNYRDPDSAALAVAHISALSSLIPWSMDLVEGIEVGNECDLYGNNGIRTKTWDWDQYASEFDMYQSALQNQAGAPFPRIQAGTFCCHNSHFDPNIPAYIQKYKNAGVANSFSYHEYPLSHCNDKNNSLYWLLEDKAASGNLAALQPMIAAAQQVGLPFYIGEGNSISCGGEYGISDTFAATLWSVDSLFAHAAAGITRWNYHGCTGGAYTAIAYEDKTADVPTVNPLYYGIWAFTVATQKDSVVYNASITSTTNPYVKVWSTQDASGIWRVTVIHKDVNATSPAQVTIAPPASSPAAAAVQFGAASLVRLAPSSGSVFSTNGLSFGGLTFDGTTTGKPSGTPVSEPVPENGRGGYTFNVQPTSVVIFTLLPV